MDNFKKYQRTQITEMRPVTIWDIEAFMQDRYPHLIKDKQFQVSVSAEAKKNGSPKKGDMIARNIENHNDQWLVEQHDFERNCKLM